MPKNILADWIIEQKKAGNTESQIRASLIQQGYKQNEVDNAIMISRTGKKTKAHKWKLLLIVLLIVILLIAVSGWYIYTTYSKIAFSKEMFGKLNKEIIETASQEPEPPTPTETNQLTLSRSTIVFKSNNYRDENLKIAFFNAGSNECKGCSPKIVCEKLDATLSSTPKSIPQKSTHTFDAVLKIDGQLNKGNDVCTISIGDYFMDIMLGIR